MRSGKVWFFLMCGAVAFLGGCQGHAPKPEVKKPEVSNPVVADPVMMDPVPMAPSSEPTSNAEILANDGTLGIGDVTTCPVSGEWFTVGEGSPSVEHKGGTYYFCCGGCEDRFREDPERFLSKNRK